LDALPLAIETFHIYSDALHWYPYEAMPRPGCDGADDQRGIHAMHHGIVAFSAQSNSRPKRVFSDRQERHLETEFGFEPLSRGHNKRLLDGDQKGVIGEQRLSESIPDLEANDWGFEVSFRAYGNLEPDHFAADNPRQDRTGIVLEGHIFDAGAAYAKVLRTYGKFGNLEIIPPGTAIDEI